MKENIPSSIFPKLTVSREMRMKAQEEFPMAFSKDTRTTKGTRKELV
jgi:hypothetical protein